MSKVTEITRALAEPICAANGLSLWDVEYIKEAGSYYLRIYIDKVGGISIDDCEVVSRELSDLLDEADPIQEAYTFEVSSAGADRILRKPEHFAAYLGQKVDLKLYGAKHGAKAHSGELLSYEDGDLSLRVGAEDFAFAKQDIAQVRLHVSF